MIRVMYMRGKLFIPVILAAVMLLSSCTQRINGAADELRRFSWDRAAENGNFASLMFCETKAYLFLKTQDSELRIRGIGIADEERLLICDEASGMNYTFGYKLYGDRIELSINGGTITLDKYQ